MSLHQEDRLFESLIAAKKAILYGLIIGAVIASLAMLILPKEYRAEIVIAPIEKTSGQDISSLLPRSTMPALQYFTQRLAGLASIEFLTFENTLQTQRIAQSLKQNSAITEQLFPDMPATDVSTAKIRDYLQKEIAIIPVGTTPLRRIVFYHTDPSFAAAFLQMLYDRTEGLMKQDVKERANHILENLDQALRETRSPDHREALVAMLKEQEHLKMLASVDTAYAARVIEPPVTTPKPVRPNGYILFPFLMIAGAFIGYISHFLLIGKK